MRRIVPILVTCGLVGCVSIEPGPSPEQVEQISEYVSAEAPTPEHPLDIRFERGLHLLGYRVQQAGADGELTDVESITEGQPATVTWYWHVTEDLDSHHLLFTHALDGSGTNRENLDRDGVLRRGDLYQPGSWAAGQYIRDVQEITIDHWGSDELTLLLGVYNGPHRLLVVTGDSDGAGRAHGLTLPVSSAG